MRYQWTDLCEKSLQETKKSYKNLKEFKILCNKFTKGKEKLDKLRNRFCEGCGRSFQHANIVREQFDSSYSYVHFGVECCNPDCREFRVEESLEGFQPNGFFREEIMVKTFVCKSCSCKFESLETEDKILCPYCGNVVKEKESNG